MQVDTATAVFGSAGYRKAANETEDSRQALALSPRCHAHVHCCLVAVGDGNMW